jgi:hypothetical protein
MPEERSSAVLQAVAATPGVEEAYLPQCYAAGFVDPPAQVLVIVLARGVEAASVMPSLGAAISRIFPPDEYLDILPSLDHGMLQTIRETGTQIYARTAPQSPSWWKRIFSGSDEKA